LAEKFELLWLDVASPVPVAVTLALAVPVEPPDAYCTTTVQVLPGFTTKPDTHVPPLVPVTMENAPAVGPLTLLTVGAALNVNAPAVAPVAVFVTVIVPVSVPAFAGVGFSAGEGAENVSVAPCTVNVMALLVPDPVVILTDLAPSEAPAEMVNVAVASVELMTLRALTLTPPPETVSEVAPVRSVPVIVTGTDVPRSPTEGAIEVNVGAGRATTLNETGLLVPPGAVTVTFLAEPVAAVLIVKVALTWVSFTTVRPLTLTPPPDTLIAVVPVSPLPKSLTGIVCPRTA